MNKILSTIRIAALLTLAAAGTYGIFCTPADDSATWIMDFLTSKCLGVLCLCILYMLYSIWKRTDRVIAAYDRWLRKEADL